jgi:hypothetical protein
MLALTSLEKTLIAVTCVLVVILGFAIYERYEGAAACKSADTRAELLEAHTDAADVNASVSVLQKQLVAIPIAAPGDVPMLVCSTPRSMSPRPATGSAEPVALPHIADAAGVQAGIESGSDIGPIVQDLTLGGMLAATNAQDLYDLEVKEASNAKR